MLSSHKSKHRRSPSSRNHSRRLERGIESLEHRLTLSGVPNWAMSIGGEGSETVRALAVDGAGYAYTVVNIEDGDGSGVKDVTLSQTTPEGVMSIQRVLGQTSVAGSRLSAWELAVADDGSAIYVTGSFSGDHDLDGDQNPDLTGSGQFIAKYTINTSRADFDFDWIRSVGSSSEYDLSMVTEVTVAGSDVFLVGYFQHSLAFGGETILTSTVGDEAAGFLMKLEDTTNGPQIVFTTQIQESGSVAPDQILVNDNDEIYLAGEFGGITLSDSSSQAVIGGQLMTTGRRVDAFVAKITLTDGASPEVAWAHQIAKSATKREKNGLSIVQKIDRGTDGAIYVGGNFISTRDFGAAQFTAFSINEDFQARDGYVLRIDEDPSGMPAVTWVSQIGSWGSLDINSVGIQDDTLFVAGSFDGTADFDPSGEVVERNATAGTRDVFLLQLDSTTGNYTSVQKIGVAGDESVTDLVVGTTVHLLGRFSDPLLPTPGGTIASHGREDAMLIHINPAAPQLRIEPPVVSITEQESQLFTAFDADEEVPVNWILDGVEVKQNASSYDFLAGQTPGRHQLKIELTETGTGTVYSYIHLFDVTTAVDINAPSNLTAEVVISGASSYITLNWIDNSGNEDGFFVWYNNPKLTTGWTLLATLGQNETTYVHRVNKKSGAIQYQVSAFADVNGQIIESPKSEVLEVNAGVPGAILANDGLINVHSKAVAAAVDQVFAGRKKAI